MVRLVYFVGNTSFPFGEPVSLKVTGDVKYKKNGMILFRLDNGFSIPITIME